MWIKLPVWFKWYLMGVYVCFNGGFVLIYLTNFGVRFRGWPLPFQCAHQPTTCFMSFDVEMLFNHSRTFWRYLSHALRLIRRSRVIIAPASNSLVKFCIHVVKDQLFFFSILPSASTTWGHDRRCPTSPRGGTWRCATSPQQHHLPRKGM